MAPSPGGDDVDINEEIDNEVTGYQALDGAYQGMLTVGDSRPARQLEKILKRIQEVRDGGVIPAAGDQRLREALAKVRSKREELWNLYMYALVRSTEAVVLRGLRMFDPEVARIGFGRAVTTFWLNPQQFDPQRDPIPWLRTVARNEAISEARRRAQAGNRGTSTDPIADLPSDAQRLLDEGPEAPLPDCPHGRELAAAIEIILASDPAEWAGKASYPPGLPMEVVRRKLLGEGTTEITRRFHPDPWPNLATATSVVSRICGRFVKAMGYFGFSLIDEGVEPVPGSEFLRKVKMQSRRGWVTRRLYYKPTCDMPRICELADLHVPMVLDSNGHLANGNRVAELRDGDLTITWVCRQEAGR